MTNLDLEALKALCEKATPGPWRSSRIRYRGFGIDTELPCMNGLRAWFSVGNVYARDDAERLMSEGAVAEAKTDAAFIAAARDAMPKLIAEVERLRRALVDVIGCDHHNHGPESQSTKIARRALTGDTNG